MNKSQVAESYSEAQAVPYTDKYQLQEILSRVDRPPKAGPVTASLIFGWRALLKIKYVPEQMFDVIIFPVMFTLMFTYLFGGALAGSPSVYLQYLLPGILVQNVVFLTVYTGFGLNTDITKGIFDRIRTLPVWRPSALVGNLMGDAVRYITSSIIVIALGLALGYRPEGGALGLTLGVLLLLIFSFSMSWIWTSLGLVLRTPNSVMGASMIILFPLTFASNIFVDPQTMPDWLKSFVDINPVTLLVNGVRGLANNTASLGDIALVLLASMGLVAVFAPLTMYIYRRKS